MSKVFSWIMRLWGGDSLVGDGEGGGEFDCFGFGCGCALVGGDVGLHAGQPGTVTPPD